DQLAWLEAQLIDSTARWQVLGQQVLMARYSLPAPILEALEPSISGGDALGAGTAAVLAAVAAKNKAPEDRTPEEQALLDSAVPYNLDAWDGYAFERDRVLEVARQMNSRLVALAGDTHNAWASQLLTATGEVVGVELATASVSSPGLEAVLGVDAARLFAPLISVLVDDLVYANLLDRGYLVTRFAADSVTAQWRYVTTIDTVDYSEKAAAFREQVIRRADMLLT
ncbi:MAG: alkaline phosphatase D family protein, partial [Haliea sp.]|nr:alkaline phosphatase D family protein [Haliea sp.]